jgi:hypothetical protein
MKRLFVALLFLTWVLFPSGAYAWGFMSHRIIHQLAIYALPSSLQQFYYGHRNYILDESVRPDKRRSSDKKEAPLHFIDLDYYGDSAAFTMPEEWEKAIQMYHPDTLIKYGTAPWHIMKMKEHLTNAFRSANLDSILFYSADLGHYVADVHVPFHATINYDGQLTNQRGIHSFWETKLPTMFINDYQLYAGSVRYVDNTRSFIWQAVRQSLWLVQPSLDLEREVSTLMPADKKYEMRQFGTRLSRVYSDTFAIEYHKRLDNMVERRLKDASYAVAAFWYAAWVDAGRPNLRQISAQALSKAQRRQLSSELKWWKRNQLAANKMLLGRTDEAE